MNTKTIKLCRECGKPMAPDALLGLCPECMMKAGLPSASKPSIPVASGAFVEGPETETKEFVPGTKLGYFGDYELLEEIARGGMGVVYKARQSSLKRIVAVKMIRSGGLAGEAEVRRFHTEAEAAAQLQHPNIVAIHEIGEHEGRHYFSMDFVEGKNLAQIADGKPVAAQSAAEWLKAIAGAVQFAHQRGVLHRDLKPQNVMLDAAGRPRVTDFGLAKDLASDSTLTQTGVVMGSPSYMPPEQARGRNDLVGPASDVYSPGAILYELLTGRPPFRGKSTMDTLSQVVNDEPPRPRALNPGAPVDLETVCLKCLEKDPARRYPTARELEADLGRFLADEPVQARPASAVRRTTSWLRRHPWMLSAALSVLILTLTGLAYGLWEQTRFLTWLNAHPGYVKAPGPHTARMNWTNWILLPKLEYRAIGLMLVAFPLFLIYRKFATGESLRNIIKPPGGTTLPVFSWYFAGLGALCVMLALFMAAEAINAWVWEGVSDFWSTVITVALIFYYGMRLLLTAVRQLTRIQIEPRPEDRPAPLSPEQLAPIHGAIFAGRTSEALKLYRAATGGKAPGRTAGRADLRKMEAELKRSQPEKFSANALRFDQGRRGWMLLGGIILISCLWVLSLQQDFSKANLFPLSLGLVVGGTIRFALSLFDLGFGAGRAGAETSGVAVWKRVYRGMGRWIKSLARIAVTCVALVILALDFLFSLAAYGNTHTNPSEEHYRGFFTCGLAVGLLLIHLLVTKRASTDPRPEAKRGPLSPEQLAPIHEAIFAGRTGDAQKLYLAATGDLPDKRIVDLLKLQKMVAELKQSQPEKFSAEALKRPDDFGIWVTVAIILLAGVFILSGQSLWRVFWLAEGLFGGAVARWLSSNKMSGWKSAYQGMRRWVKCLAWVVVGCFALAIPGFAVIIFGFFAHPGKSRSPQEILFMLFACGLLGGWLLVHLRLGKQKAP